MKGIQDGHLDSQGDTRKNSDEDTFAALPQPRCPIIKSVFPFTH